MRNLAVTNHLPHSVLAEIVGLEGQEELIGSGPPAQVVPAGATAGFDVHFKCQTEQVRSQSVTRCSFNQSLNEKDCSMRIPALFFSSQTAVVRCSRGVDSL